MCGDLASTGGGGDAVGPVSCGARSARPTRYPGHKNRNKRKGYAFAANMCVVIVPNNRASPTSDDIKPHISVSILRQIAEDWDAGSRQFLC